MAQTPIIIDEFLTFVQNKIDVLDELSLVQICATNFTDSEIETGKSTLITSLPEGNRNVVRKGEDKNKKNVKDVIKILKESDPSRQPIFVARNLNRLPPVSFDSIDVTRLLKDMIGMKTELQNIRNDAATKAEIANLQTKISSDLTSLRTSINKLDGNFTKTNKTQHLNKSYEVSEIITTPKSRQLTKECTDKRLLHAPALVTRSRPRSSEPIHTPSYRDIVVPVSIQPQPDQNLTTGQNKVEDAFTLVTHRKRKLKMNMCGTATGPSKIQVAELSSSIYISRLSKDTNIDDIRGHIQEMGETCNEVQLLAQQRETDFNSYKVIVPKSKLHVYLSNDFWPEGVRYRRFREFIPKVTSRVNKHS